MAAVAIAPPMAETDVVGTPHVLTFRERLHAVRNVVFQSGGPRGISFVSLLEHMRNKYGVDFGLRCPPIEAAAGASIGAPFVLMIAMRFSAAEIAIVSTSMTPEKLFQPNPALLVQDKKWCLDGGDGVQEMLGDILRRRFPDRDPTTITMGEVQRIAGDFAFYFVSVDANTREVMYISAQSHPNMPVMVAVHGSMGLWPATIFTTWTDPLTGREYRLVDGAIKDGFPIGLFPPGIQTLGFKFEESMDEAPVTSFVGMVGRMLNLASSPSEHCMHAMMLAKGYGPSILPIHVGDVQGNQVTLSPATRAFLLQAGAEALVRAERAWKRRTAGADATEDQSVIPLPPANTLPILLRGLVQDTGTISPPHVTAVAPRARTARRRFAPTH